MGEGTPVPLLATSRGVAASLLFGRDAMELIYLDNNATTPMLPAVRQAMEPFLSDSFGNPASAHQAGRRARRALEDARESLAELLGAFPDEVLFTSGATEANNLALFGAVRTPPGHLLASPLEHPSVSEPLAQLGQLGFTLEHFPVDPQGRIRVEALDALFRPDTVLVAVMLANHETGVIQPIQLLSDLLARQDHPIWFHCDATQAVGKLPVDFRSLGVSTLALSGHKFHGPQGIGALLLRRGLTLRPRTWGGHQQQGLRPGTEPVALAVGLAVALELAQRERCQRWQQVLHLRNLFLTHLRRHIPAVVVNGPEPEEDSPDGQEPPAVLPHTLNLSFPGLEASTLLMNLDLAGVACSTGSACSSGSLLPSPVLQAMGVPDDILRSAMRFSFSPLLTEDDVEEAAGRVCAVVQRLRGHL
jgi:cysteine desulfurase